MIRNQTSIEDLSIFSLKNSKSMEMIKEKVSRLKKLTRLASESPAMVIVGEPPATMVNPAKQIGTLSMQIKDAFDTLELEIPSLKGKSTLSNLKAHHIKLVNYAESLEGYLKYRNEPFSTIFSPGCRLPIPQRFNLPEQHLELFVIGQNDDGQLGLSREMVMATTKFKKPFRADDVCLIACGSMHSVLVDSLGDLYTFGFEDCISREGPEDEIIKINSDRKALQVCCGEYFTAVLDTNGMVWYFGGFRSSNGEHLFYEKSPKRLNLTSPVVKIASGESHLLLLCQDMNCYVIGVAEFGQCGISTSSSTPLKVYLTEPVLDIYASGFCSFFMTPSGLYGCGNNGFGELGIGNYKQSLHPQAVSFPSQTVIVDVAGGLHHTLFLDDDGQVWAAGKNFDGQLGLSLETVTTTSTPVKVDIKEAKYPIRKVSAGTSSHHSCNS
jgi:Regulator of chromosome condensation (RCC1) repeat